MKVKVRRRKPALVSAEQAKKKSDDIIVEFVINGETFSVRSLKTNDIRSDRAETGGRQ